MVFVVVLNLCVFVYYVYIVRVILLFLSIVFLCVRRSIFLSKSVFRSERSRTAFEICICYKIFLVCLFLMVLLWW